MKAMTLLRAELLKKLAQDAIPKNYTVDVDYEWRSREWRIVLRSNKRAIGVRLKNYPVAGGIIERLVRSMVWGRLKK